MDFQLSSIKVVKIADAAGAGTSQVDSSILDMTGFEGVIFFTNVATANAGNFIKAIGGKQSNLSDGADIAGSRVNTAPSEEALVLEISKPVDRYIRCSAVRGVSTASGEIWAILYGPKTEPQSSVVSGTLAAKTIVSPAYGTA